ncbi:hypothetical protein P0D91_04065 [Pseudomonas sp. CBSPBW29]|uniref:hypothetical protein n=1 Tax=Pseudomonas sp. CBS TaxID=2971912 RepID=UPI0021AD3525|nr:hypothetical protein [Pseudomonas sp. CBS]WEL43515.1 hypothetical protein P0D91_04065 [Pseudomonas sp. CBSPBW29]WEL64582.1 hypothetical protein P0D93_31615 [Pseudomonas sp. CBSPGW29]WEL68051.1 hypothetical protein P0D94_17530 [Pseudomonas sp. CBSPCGW29]WEL80681.1 hypothetical protein P0D95_22220 [Pseudomonas sp. CBSPCAW29]WEL89198.1 hypothetical protein P0D90_04520 [Pseudomonas sp. CBSPCBW29]
MKNAIKAIENYIFGKDGNRPDLLRYAFSPDATLNMEVQTSAILFPPHVQGRKDIADVLVRDFSLHYENVYTFCFGAPPKPETSDHKCKWLVGMTTKTTGELRVGCGAYHWVFSPKSGLATQLSITIKTMQECPPQYRREVMDWLQGRNYPWCTSVEMLDSAPSLACLQPILVYVADDPLPM